MEEIAMRNDIDTITDVREAYKLGFIHGAMAMMQYVKRKLVKAERPIPQVVQEKKPKLLPNPEHHKNVMEILTLAHRLTKSLIKLSVDDSGLHHIRCLDSYYHINPEINGIAIKKYITRPESQCFTSDVKEDKLIKKLQEIRCDAVIDAIRRYRRCEFARKENERLSQL